VTQWSQQTGQVPSEGGGAVAYIFLRIGTDPTNWVHENADLDTVAARLSQATAPVVLPIAGPLQGSLVVSPSAAATISVARPSPLHGVHPSHIASPRWPVLYLPSPTSPTPDSPGYPLEPNTDLAALEQHIVAAMREGTVLSVQVAEVQGGVVLLNGATLSFAVLAQAHG
jgi:hypothetical protein